jgi:integrase
LNGEELETLIWDTWMQDLDTNAKGTKKIYLSHFKRFLKRWNITADKLYEMRKADFQSIEPLERKRIERMVKTSMSELEKAGYAASTCKNVRKAVSSFLESMDMELHLKKKDMPKGESKGQVVITAPQIRKMCDQMISWLRLRNRSMLLTLKDNGLRISDLSMIDYGYWLQAKTILNEHGETFKVFDPEKTEKMKVIAYVHLGPESVAAIEEYLEDRQDRGEILTEKSPLFLGQNGERITKNALTNLFRYQARNLRLKMVSAHSLRKFHTTSLEDAGMPANWIKKLQGKAASVYSQPEKTGKLTEKYIECYDALRVLEKPIDKREVERLREKLERSNQENTEMSESLRQRDEKQKANYEKLKEQIKKEIMLELGLQPPK